MTIFFLSYQPIKDVKHVKDILDVLDIKNHMYYYDKLSKNYKMCICLFFYIILIYVNHPNIKKYMDIIHDILQIGLLFYIFLDVIWFYDINYKSLSNIQIIQPIEELKNNSTSIIENDNKTELKSKIVMNKEIDTLNDLTSKMI